MQPSEVLKCQLLGLLTISRSTTMRAGYKSPPTAGDEVERQKAKRERKSIIKFLCLNVDLMCIILGLNGALKGLILSLNGA